MSFPTRTKSQAFVESVANLYGQLGGFDGLDWDTFEGNQAPDTGEMTWISLTLKGRYPGFLVTAPPAPWDKVGMTFCAQMASAGALDYCAPQYYDGPGLAVQSYVVSNIDQWATLLGPCPPSSPSSFLGVPLACGDTYFIDEFNAEFSRDIEPMTGGFEDA